MNANVTRTQIIQQEGLPNEVNGFFSDHLPIGVLFGPIPITTTNRNEDSPVLPQQDERTIDTTTKSSSPLSTAAQQRRVLYQSSVHRRRRHNAVVQMLVQYIRTRIASQNQSVQLLCDVPLYKWPWKLKVRQKTRAPDLCVVWTVDSNNNNNSRSQQHVIVVLEVTVVDRPHQVDEAYRHKVNKYRDVIWALRNECLGTSEEEDPPSNVIVQPFNRTVVIALDAQEGNLASQSINDLQTLWSYLLSENDNEAAFHQFLQDLQSTVLSYSER
jgi:hypothetical protein